MMAPSDALLMQPTVRVLRLVGNGEGGPPDSPFLLRFSVGLTWRP